MIDGRLQVLMFFSALLALSGAFDSARAAPLQDLLSNPAGQPVAFVEATSRALLHSGHVDFAAAIELDLPVEAQRFELDALFSQPPASGPRFAIILDVIEARASRRVTQLKREPSTVFLGYNGAPFTVPADDAARTAAGFVEQPQAALNPLGVNPAVGQPLILPYAYERATVLARKQMTAHVYVVDRVANTYVHNTLDAHEENRFEVAYRVSSLDPRRNTIGTQYDGEADVDDFESRELLINLSDVLRDAAAKQGEARPYDDLKDLRRVLLTGQNRTLQTLAANRFDARPLNDPRFDSVVVVYTGSGTLGSGFFVTPDIVLTNWHVIENAPFVELKRYDGQQTFGTVLGKDARLDVALVKVESRGRPVAFYTGRTLDLGLEVEAIGHPQRLEFAVTRGIVSAVRKHYSINLPNNAGEDLLYVQTDAPISPGNSGGPLFLDNRVVGMNTWSRIDGQNLNFAVHYSELLSFLNEHLPGFHVDPAQGG